MKENRKKAVVLLSGGMDSLVTTAVANKKYNLALLHIKYGQKTEKRELSSFKIIAKFYNVTEKLIIDIDHLKKIGGSSLTDPRISVFKSKKSKIPITYVPFRNANLLSMAVSWAEVIGARFIFIGANTQDSSGYPDTRQKFFKAFNKIISTGTRPETKIKILTPIINKSKRDIVKLGHRLGAPFSLSWSCYNNNRVACGECDSCKLRLKGFREAGFTDPIRYNK